MPQRIRRRNYWCSIGSFVNKRHCIVKTYLIDLVTINLLRSEGPKKTSSGTDVVLKFQVWLEVRLLFVGMLIKVSFISDVNQFIKTGSF